MLKKIGISSLAFMAFFTSISSREMVGYYSNWAQYRPAPANYTPTNLAVIMPKLTKVNYAFLPFGYQSAVAPPGPTPTTPYKINFFEWNDTTVIPQIVANAHANGVKVMLSIGGYNFNSTSSPYGQYTTPYFSAMVSDPAHYAIGNADANNFGNSFVALHNSLGVDGLDIDWEFPGVPERGGSGADYQNLLTFANSMHASLQNLNLLFTFAVPAWGPASPTFATGSYTDPVTGGTGTVTAGSLESYMQWLAVLSQSCDALNVMTYDYNGAFPGTTETGENSPLYSCSIESLSSDLTVTTLLTPVSLSGGHTVNMSPSKLIMGIGAYGRSFGGVSYPAANGLSGQPNGPGANYNYPTGPQHYTNESGFQAYYEVLLNLDPAGGGLYQQTQINPITLTSYAWGTGDQTWVSYDSSSTAFDKGQYISNKNLGGAMIWAIDLDNFVDFNTGAPGPYDITTNVVNGMANP